MASIRNIGQSALSVPDLNNRLVEPDELVDGLDNELATRFAGQDGVWKVELDDDDPRTLPELKAELADRGLPTTGRKADLIARLAEPEQPAAEPSTIESGE